MTKFAPTYIPYSKRILSGLGSILIYSLFLTFLLFVTDVYLYRIAAAICFIIFLAFKFYSLVKRSKKYIRSIEIIDTNVKLIIVDKDKEIIHLNDDLENIRMKVVELFFGFNRVGRNFKFQIDTKRDGKFETIFEQYELGNWNLSLFKEVYSA